MPAVRVTWHDAHESVPCWTVRPTWNSRSFAALRGRRSPVAQSVARDAGDANVPSEPVLQREDSIDVSLGDSWMTVGLHLLPRRGLVGPRLVPPARGHGRDDDERERESPHVNEP